MANKHHNGGNMRRRKIIFPVTLTAALLGTTACQTTHLVISDYKSGGEGAPYALRFTQAETTIKWRVVACGRRSAKPGEDFNALPNNQFTVRAEAASEISFPEDPKRRWMLDLASLDGWFNTTDMSVTYEGGKFKSLSTAVEDKTVDTITAAAATAAQIVAIAGVVGVNLTGDACADLVEAVDIATKTVEKDTTDLEISKSVLANATAAGAGGKVLRSAQGTLAAVTLKLAADTAVLDKALKAVSYEQKERWPKAGNDGAVLELPLPAAALDQWKASAWKDDADDIKLVIELQTLQANGSFARASVEDSSAMAAKVAQGRIPVRLARPGAVVASLRVGNAAPKVLATKEGAIIQSGDLIYVPVEYKWPRSSSNGFGLDANGYLTSVSHKQSSAPGQTLAKGAQIIAEQAKPLFKSDLDKLKAENDELTAKKNNAELKAALAPKDAPTAEALELKAVTAELTLKKAKLELMLVDRWAAALGGTTP